jgi:hypothetical protein
MKYKHIYVISKFSPISPKGFKEFLPLYIHISPDFSHRVFQEVIRLITRPQQEEQIDQQGILKKNRLIRLVLNL